MVSIPEVDNPKDLISRLSKECSQKGFFVGGSGSIALRQGDHVYVGPSPSLIRSSELCEEDIFQLSAKDGSVVQGPAEPLKIHPMAPLHLEIFKANPSIGCVLECRSISSVVTSLMVKGKVLTVNDPEVVLGPNERKMPVNIPVIDNSTDLMVMAENITLKLKNNAGKATAKPAEPVCSATDTSDVVSIPDELEIEVKPDDLVEKDDDAKSTVESVTEVQELEDLDLDELAWSAVLVRNKGFFVWAKTWTECMNRAEHINQMLEVCNQMKIMGLNVYLQLMVRPNALTQAQKRQFNNDTNVATQNKSPQKIAESKNAGGNAPKRARIEPPVFDVDDEKEPTKEVAAAPEKSADVKPETATEPAKKKKWIPKKKTGGQAGANKPEPAKVQPTSAKPLELHTKKNLSGVKARVGGPVKIGFQHLQRPAPGRITAGNQSSRGAKNNQGAQNNRGGRGGPTPPRMAQVPSPWAQPQTQTWYTGGF